ncbi:hypothetical protein KKH39_03340 [Patescibacteria group bacterium]|nr:hypothetical protein [Patescibacteria group bacterium]
MSDKDNKILDSDADGLTDEEEKKLGTDPFDQDSDHDGLGDYQEVKVYGTDPLDRDTDCDNITDGTEVKMGRNPRGRGTLRDLFLPTPCNNYRPNALHPRRLVFHAVSAVVIKALMVIFALSFPVQAWLSPDILTDQANKIIDLTNDIRLNLELKPLVKSELLTQAALNKSQDMLINEYFAHVGPDNQALRNWLYSVGYNFHVAGENLAMGFSGADQVVTAWTNSETHYANLIDPEFTDIGVGVVSGDYQGYDTTLIAQYFGTQTLIEPQPEPEPEVLPSKTDIYDAKIEQAAVENLSELQPEPELEPEPEVLAEEPTIPEPEPQEVLAEEIEQVNLATPVLLTPLNKVILDNDLNLFKISALGAQTLTIVDNNEEIVTKYLENGYLEIALRLDQGQHYISLISKASGQESRSIDYLLTVDSQAPLIDHEKTKILVNKPTGQDDIVVKATVYVSEDANFVNVAFADQTIDMQRDLSEVGKWIGNKIMVDVDYNQYFNPVVLATVTVGDKAGNQTIQDVAWQEIKPAVGSTVNQYVFVKKNPSESIKPLFNLGSIYYKILLGLLIITILLTIFVEFRQQRLKTIASALGVVGLLVCLTIF